MRGKYYRTVFERKIKINVNKKNNFRYFFVILRRFKAKFLYRKLIFKQLKTKLGY